MIPKLIPSDSRRNTFATLVKYIARDKEEYAEERELFGAPEMGTCNFDCDLVDDLDAAIALLNGNAAMARRSKQDPVNHYMLSWQAGEHPTREQVGEAVGYFLDSIGLGEAMAVWAIHRDTDYDHVHIALNRIHPVRGTWLKVPQRSYVAMHKACREIEQMQGWAHDRGAYVVRDGHIEPRGPRRDGEAPAPSGRARRAEKNVGAPSFQEWVTRDPARAAADVLHDPHATWADLHRALAPLGVRVQPGERRGLVVTTTTDGRVIAGKASLLGLGNLQKRLGAYQAPSDVRSVPTVPEKTYGWFLQAFQRGDVGWEVGESATAAANSAARTADRRAERRALHGRFLEQHGSVAKALRANAWSQQREREVMERKALRESAKGAKREYLRQARENFMPDDMARGLWAADMAKQRATLQAQHAEQRRQLMGRYDRAEAWREWLTEQAMHGDEAAGRALRGLQYREGQGKNRQRNGIEGDEQAPFQPGALAALRPDVDWRRQSIVYRDATGAAKLTDRGPRIEVHDKYPEALTVEAAVLLAAEKYGGQITISGSSEFREEAARTAVRLGVRVRDADLQELVREARGHAPDRGHGPGVGRE